MRTVGLVTEYNPFHNGHLYHLRKSKEITNSDYSVAVMSGNFVQRGEPALIDKWSRAKIAIDSGVDLIIELPTLYACQSAEFFAYGAVKLLDSTGIIDSICFGSEYEDLELLTVIAKILVDEPELFKNSLRESLSLGNPYPKARTYALKQILQENMNNKLDSILNSSNCILGIEYLKALNKINSNITPYVIKRIGANYNTDEFTGNISSANSIRNRLLNNLDINSIESAVPLATYKCLNEFQLKFSSFNSINYFNQILLYLLRNNAIKKLSNVMYVEEGLENRITRCSNIHNSITEILDCIKTKRYTYTRLKRILINLLLEIDKNTFHRLYNKGPLYIRVLGANIKGMKLLAKAKKTTKIPIITKFSNYKNNNSDSLNEMIEIDKNATNIYFLGLRNNNTVANLDYTVSPYFRKK